MEAYNKSQAPEQRLHSPKEIQDGNVGHSPVIPSKEFLGHFHRSKRRLPTHPNPSVSSQIPGLPLQKRRFLLQSSTIRPLHSSKSFHSSNQGRPSFPPKTRHSCLRLPRRLAVGGTHSPGDIGNHLLHYITSSKSRLDREFREVRTSSVSDKNLPGRSHRLHIRNSYSFPPKGSYANKYGFRDASFVKRSRKTVASTAGPHGQYGGCDPILPTIHETNPDLSPTTLLSVPELPVEKDPDPTSSQRPSTLVDVSTQYNIWETFQGDQAQIINYYRRFPLRMGRSMEVRDPVRSMEHGRRHSSHQPPRIEGDLPSHLQLGSFTEKPPDNDPVRQLHSGFVHQSPGRDQIDIPLPPNLGSPPPLSSVQHRTQGLSPSRPRECNGGCPVQRESPGNRVVPVPSVGQPHIRDIRQTNDRPLCNSIESQTADFLHEVLPPSSLGDRRSCDPMEQPIRLRLPSMVSNPAGSPQTQGIQCSTSSSRPMLAKPAVVSSTPGDAHRSSVQVSITNQPPNTSRRENLASTSTTPPSIGLETVTQRFISEGLSQEAALIASGSRRPSTVSTYDSRLVRFREWSIQKNINPLEAPVESIADFFVSLFNEGKQVSTIRNYRSAIASIHKGFADGSSISSNSTLTHLLKGMFNKRPPRKCLAPSWSINDVLTTLSLPPYEPMHNTTLELLTHKTLFLIAAASARRRSELHALTTKKGFIRFSQAGVFLIPDPSFLTKNETVSFSPGEIYLPNISSLSSIHEDKRVCPVRALKWYLERTKSIRSSDRLFLIPRSPFNPASKDTLSRWIVNLISPHASNDESIHAHQLRAHATSTAWFKGVSLDNILRAAAWKTPSTFVACYLTNVVSEEGAFARAVLGVPDLHRPGLPPSSQC